MNEMNANKFADRAVGFYMQLVSGVLLLIALVRYLTCGGVTEYGIQASFVVAVVASIALIVASIWVDSDFISVITPAVGTAALAVFLIASINILTGYLFSLNMFGDVTMIGAVAQVSILTGVAVVLLIVSAFLKKNKSDL